MDAVTDVVVSDGTLAVDAADDGLHADGDLAITNGTVSVTRSYEAIEGSTITISGGAVDTTSSDDGLNAGSTLTISGGTVVVNGPTENMNGAIDANGTLAVTGGVLLAAGSSGMAEAPDSSSSQGWVAVSFSSGQQAGTVVHIVSADGTVLASFTASKSFSSLVFSSADITSGSTNTVYTGGSASGESTGGLTAGGSIDSATSVGTFTAGEAPAGGMGMGGGTRPGS